MLRIILTNGTIAGLIVASMFFITWVVYGADQMVANGQFVGYLTMIVALSLIFVGVKRWRDRALGGVIKFMPAFLIGLGISAVAGVIYVIGWEITLAATNYSFMGAYVEAVIEAERAKGVSEAELEAFIDAMRGFEAQYSNPLIRVPITFIEIFPVGVIISLISAALLRNPRFLPLRPSPAA
ncbi:hypothetical protein U91I_01627 [alpha proteobacterium U9-1i]|nr:hypothetical protein U91I_01627 [alpha proteobacterium U9-1i]